MEYSPHPLNNSSYHIPLDPVDTAIQVARAHLPALPHWKQMVCNVSLERCSKLKKKLKIPPKSLTSISLQETSQNLGKEDAQVKADGNEKPCHYKSWIFFFF